ncbi:MAG: reverse transcriptase domain-containing protein [Chitinophagales bacterium]
MPDHFAVNPKMASSTHFNYRVASKTPKGIPQGSPLSPLSNIMLDVLDKELESKGLRYVRYADDFSIYTKSKAKAKATGNEVFSSYEINPKRQ